MIFKIMAKTHIKIDNFIIAFFIEINPILGRMLYSFMRIEISSFQIYEQYQNTCIILSNTILCFSGIIDMKAYGIGFIFDLDSDEKVGYINQFRCHSRTYSNNSIELLLNLTQLIFFLSSNLSLLLNFI